jgi:choline-sulfatase
MPDHARARRPDLVLVMTDQQRHDQLGYSSGGHFETPALDALAASGVVFEAAYSASTVCVPARSALLTGLAPHRLPTQENGSALREGFWTVAHALRAAGYETALFGKMHFAPVHADHGFETMRLCEHIKSQGLGPRSRERGDVHDDYHDWLEAQGLRDYRYTPDGEYAFDASMPASYPADAHPTAWIEREVSAFLESRTDDRPLFLVISFPHPHAPYDPPEPYRSMYDPADSVLPSDGYEVNEELPLVFRLATSGELAAPEANSRPEADDPERVRAFLATVRGLIRQVDDAVGRLVDLLDLDETVLCFTSDHGDYSGHRGLMRKHPWIPFDDLARVPLFVTGRRIEGGRRVEDPVQSYDVALTYLDYAGVAPPAGVDFDARSLRPVLEDRAGPDDRERTVLSGTSIGFPMVRRGRYKYIEHVDQGQPVLFDLERDPHETTNLVEDPACRDVAEAMGKLVRHTMQQPVLDLRVPT